MLNRSRCFLLVLVALALATIPGSAQAAGCSTASISIRTGTATVAPGTTIGIAGSINNCSSKRARYTLLVSALSSCAQKIDIASNRMTFNPGENKMYTLSYPMPINTCTGPWEATVQVFDNNGRLASASTTITVQ